MRTPRRIADPLGRPKTPYATLEGWTIRVESVGTPEAQAEARATALRRLAAWARQTDPRSAS